MSFPFTVSGTFELSHGQSHGLSAAEIEEALVNRLLERQKRWVRREPPDGV